MDWCLVSFASASGAIAAQKALRDVCKAEVMPVLRQVSAGCGIALRLKPQDVDKAKIALAELPGWQCWAVAGTGEALRCERL